MITYCQAMSRLDCQSCQFKYRSGHFNRSFTWLIHLQTIRGLRRLVLGYICLLKFEVNRYNSSHNNATCAYRVINYPDFSPSRQKPLSNNHSFFTQLLFFLNWLALQRYQTPKLLNSNTHSLGSKRSGVGLQQLIEI